MIGRFTLPLPNLTFSPLLATSSLFTLINLQSHARGEERRDGRVRAQLLY